MYRPVYLLKCSVCVYMIQNKSILHIIYWMLFSPLAVYQWSLYSHTYLFRFSVPVSPEATFWFIDLSAWYLKQSTEWSRHIFFFYSLKSKWGFHISASKKHQHEYKQKSTLNAMVSYGSAAKSRYCQRRSGGSMRCSYADMKRCRGPIPSAISG